MVDCAGPWGGVAALAGAGSTLRGALDQRAIVAATADLLEYVMSDSGQKVRTKVVQVREQKNLLLCCIRLQAECNMKAYFDIT